jgi:glucosamine 6-phosphate synthetase-like amidotransferase/phosphosugar isomerase protein
MLKALEQLSVIQIDKNYIWLVTNNISSEMSLLCGHIFPIKSENEIVFGTKSFQNTVFVLYLIAQILMEKNPITSETETKLANLVNNMRLYSKNWNKTTDQIIEFLGDEMQFLYFISKGASLSSAEHGALSVKGYDRVFAEAISLGLFFHGPFQIIDKNFRCILLIGDDLGPEYEILLTRLINLITKKLGLGKLVFLSNTKKTKISLMEDSQILAVNYECEIAALSPIFEMFIFQMVFLKIAKKRGLLT